MEQGPKWFTAVTLCIGAATAQAADDVQKVTANGIDTALEAFGKQSARTQKTTLAAVRAAVDAVENDYLRSVRVCIAEGKRLVSKSKLKSRRKRRRSDEVPRWRQQLSFPVGHEYAFGIAKAFKVEPTGKRTSTSRRAASDRRASLAAMLKGHLPDLDQALAAILHRLDGDRSADQFSRLLESWRYGPESFYDALDRTAGTDRSVFFYDAMLDDFILRCVPKRHADYRALRSSLQQAHDALHTAFLTYRQYRAFREAAALSLLLPPGTELPASLSRYDDAAGSMYSTREQLSMLLCAAKQDIVAVITGITKSAKALPRSLWDENYDPFPAFQSLVDRIPSPGRLASQERGILTTSQRLVAEAARTALFESLGARGH